MLRDEWAFDFSASKLAEAAAAKKKRHETRVTWWTEQKTKVMAEVRSEGIEVSESVAANYANKTSDRYGPQVMVRADLQTKLTECHQKIMEHAGKVREYDGWVQILTANAEARLKLHSDDFLFFFGS